MRKNGARLSCLLLAALALGACDPDQKKTADSAPSGNLVASAPPPRIDRNGVEVSGGDALRDAVGPAPTGADKGRVLFDGAKVPGGAEPSGSVYAGNGGSNKPKVKYTGKPRKPGLKINEPPSPVVAAPKDGGQGGANGAGGGDAVKAAPGGAGDGVSKKDGDKANAGASLSNAAGSAAGGKGQRFLLIGDSQTAGHFGRGLDEYLRRDYPSALLETYGQGGSRAAWFVPGNPASGWATWNSFFHYYKDNDPAKLTKSIIQTKGQNRKTPLIADAMKADTTVVFVALGSNHLTWSASGKATWDLDTIKQLAQAIKANNSKCVWISPADMQGPMVPVDKEKPDGPKRRKLSPDQMKKLLADADADIKGQIAGLCDYIDARLPYAGGDGIHLGETRGHEVAEAVLKEIEKLVPGATPKP